MLSIGTHCALPDCRQTDYLPFSCEKCHLQFCKDHKSPSDHQCSALKNEVERVDQVAADWWGESFCNNVVSAGAGQNINNVMFEHIESGCTKHKPQNNLFKCFICSTRELIEVRCNDCAHNFCLRHRAPMHHDCAKLINDRIDNQRRAQQSTAQQQQISQTQSRIQNRVQQRLKDAPQSDAAQRVKLMSMRSKAVGDAKIPADERVYLEVLFPMESQIEPMMMFFSKEWSIGKLIDVIAKAGKIANDNNKADAPKLGLFDLKAGEQQSNSVKLKTLIDKRLLASGQTIMLEYVDNLK